LSASKAVNILKNEILCAVPNPSVWEYVNPVGNRIC